MSAPGGWFRDGFGTPSYRTNENQILSTYPVNVLQAAGLGRRGRATSRPPVPPLGVQKDCPAGTTTYTQCGYYAVPAGDVDGLAARDRCRRADRQPVRQAATAGNGGLDPDSRKDASDPDQLRGRARVPEAAAADVPDEGRPTEFNALCEGTTEFNGFYGHGIVDAYSAVTSKGHGRPPRPEPARLPGLAPETSPSSLRARRGWVRRAVGRGGGAGSTRLAVSNATERKRPKA